MRRHPSLPRTATSVASLALCASCLLSAATAEAADDDIVYAATLTADDQSTPTESPGKGYAELRLERATLRLTWKVTYQGLTSRITAAGLYGPEINGGMRIENQYLVTETGVENLTPFPLELP